MKKYVVIFGMVALPFYGQAYDGTIAQSGLCGQTEADCSYTLYDDGHLEITGTGRMNDYVCCGAGAAPWPKKISQVSISGITYIGVSAFHDSELTEVTIPASVEELGDAAFQRAQLESVNFTENSSLKIIGDGVFNGIPSLQTLDIPSGVSAIGENAFNKSGIDNITLPDAVFSIDNIVDEIRAPYFHGLNLRALSDVANVYCSDAVGEKCEEYFNQAEFWENGVYYPMQQKATLNIKNADGSIDTYQYSSDGSAAIYRDGALKSYKGKRIYTLDEAQKVTGNVNRVSIKYR